MNYPNPIYKNTPSLAIDEIKPLKLTMMSVTPVDMSAGRKLSGFDEIPDYRIDFENAHTAERLALWIKFDDLAFDPLKHGARAVEDAIYAWISQICGKYQINELKLRIIDPTQIANFLAGVPMAQQEYDGERDSRHQAAREHVARDLFNAAVSKQRYNSEGDNIRDSSSIYSRGPMSAPRYEFSLSLGHGLWFTATEKGRLDEIVRPIVPTAPDFKIKPLGTFLWDNKVYDFYIGHPLLEGQILDRIEKNALSDALFDVLLTRFPHLQWSLNHDFQLDFAG